MPLRHLRTFVGPDLFIRNGRRLKVLSASVFSPIVMIALLASLAQAQGRAAYETPLHTPTNKFEFVASSDPQAMTKPLVVHNGGTVRFTNVRLTGLAYADSSSGSAWLVAIPRQTTVAPDELATVGMLCVDATGLRAGTYRATAAIAAREVPQPVAITITVVVTDDATRKPIARCGAAAAK